MSVKGKTKENKGEFSKKTGFVEGNVVAINPSKEQLEKLLGVEFDNKDEIEYTSTEDVDGKTVNRAQVVFWIKDVKEEGRVRSVHFFLKDQERMNRVDANDNGKVRKKQYINTLGMTAWADEAANLPEWFSSRSNRIAKVGEEEMYTFIGAWLNKLDRKDADSALSFDFSKLIQGDVSELRKQMKGEYDDTVTCLVVIRTVKKEGEEDKEYEQIYNKDFMPGFAMKQVRARTVDAEFIKKAMVTEKRKRTLLQKFVLGVKDPTYGVKDAYTLGELEDYDPTKNPLVNGKVLTEEDTEY